MKGWYAHRWVWRLICGRNSGDLTALIHAPGLRIFATDIGGLAKRAQIMHCPVLPQKGAALCNEKGIRLPVRREPDHLPAVVDCGRPAKVFAQCPQINDLAVFP